MKRIAYIQHTNPAGYPPLEHSSQILADAGWKILFLGVRMEAVESIHFLPHPNITVRLLAARGPGWRQKLQYAWFALWAAFWTVAFRSSWAYVSDPLACPTGLLLSFLPGIRVIYHEHDSPVAQCNGSQSSFMRFVLWTRSTLAGRTALCILPNERRVEQFARTVGRNARVICVWNCPARTEVSSPRALRNGGDLWVVYHGSIVPVRLPATIIEALRMLPEQVKLRVVGYETPGHKGYVAQLRTLAEKVGVAHRVEFAGTVPTRTELFEHCHKSDIGLTFMPKTSRDLNEQAMTGASNKPFDYLACGLALLVSDLPEWRAFYVETGCALAVDPDNANSIAAALRWLLDHPDELRAMGERGRQRILTEWNYETQSAPVINQLRGEPAA